jgi:hypothetical protein
MDYADYDRILRQRGRAQRDGVFFATPEDEVPATVRVEGEAAPVRMRLMAGPVACTSTEDGFSLEVRTTDERTVLGLRRFILQDPGAHNWLDGWAYTRALQQEGLLTARYAFVRLYLNGENKGIYALQEGLSPELLQAQGRTPGPIVGLDPSALWTSVLAYGGDVDAALADPVANLSLRAPHYLEIDPDRDEAASQDPVLEMQREQAAALLRDLQMGRRPASELLHVDRYGALLALADLWGATGCASYMDLGYYYDATSQKLEPVAVNANPLARQARLPLAMTYGGAQIQIAYLRHAAEIAQPAYVDGLQEALGAEWQSLARALGREGRNLTPPWETLRARQGDLLRSLDPAAPVVAYLDAASTEDRGALRIYVGNALNVPVEVLGFDVNATTFVPVDGAWLHPTSTGLLVPDVEGIVLAAPHPTQLPAIDYARFDVPLSAIAALDREIDLNRALEVRVTTQTAAGAPARLTRVRYERTTGTEQ